MLSGVTIDCNNARRASNEWGIQAEAMKLIAGIDAGGTTFKCGVFTMRGEILARRRIPTLAPEETVAACMSFLDEEARARGQTLAGLGIACFGPLDLSLSSASYGSILKTPKAGWSDYPILARFKSAFAGQVLIETDVNAALLAEMANGAAKGVESAAYITVGTGVGAGIFLNGGLVGRPSHPEFGHIRISRRPDDTGFAGVCPYHRDCLEGLASAHAFAMRFGDTEQLSPDHPGWDLEAYYLAQACQALTLTCRPQRIAIGGGLLQASHLLPRIHAHFLELMNAYLGYTEKSVIELVVHAGLGDDAGLYGAAYLACNAKA